MPPHYGVDKPNGFFNVVFISKPHTGGQGRIIYVVGSQHQTWWIDDGIARLHWDLLQDKYTREGDTARFVWYDVGGPQ